MWEPKPNEPTTIATSDRKARRTVFALVVRIAAAIGWSIWRKCREAEARRKSAAIIHVDNIQPRYLVAFFANP